MRERWNNLSKDTKSLIAVLLSIFALMGFCICGPIVSFVLLSDTNKCQQTSAMTGYPTEMRGSFLLLSRECYIQLPGSGWVPVTNWHPPY